MKRYILATLLLCLSGAGCTLAQADQRTLNSRIADLLAKFPAQDARQLEKNMEEMRGMGERGLEEMTGMLAAPGKKDNTALEYSLSGYSNYATRAGKESWRMQIASAFIKALDKLPDPETKAFIIRQLAVVGNDAAVGSIKKYLQDERLCDPAARALVKIKTPTARRALLESLKNGLDYNRLTLVEALGDMHAAEAVVIITKLAENNDKKLRKLSLYALAQIAQPSSEPFLQSAAFKSGFTYDETGATAAYLRFANQLRVNGKGQEAEKIGKLLLKKAVQDNQVHTRSAALKLLVDIQGPKAVPLLLGVINDKNAQFRAAALEFAGRFTSNSAVAAWVSKLSKVDKNIAAEIITMLGNSGNPTCLPVLLKGLQDKDVTVRAKSIKAAGKIGQQNALPALLHLLKHSSPEEMNAITNAIRVMKGPGVVNQVAMNVASMPTPESKSALINILAARGARSKIGDILPLVNSNDSLVRKAAYAALKSIVKQESLSDLFPLLLSTSDKHDITELQKAIIASIAQVPDTVNRTFLIEAQMNQIPTEKQYLYFEILSAIDGKQALRRVTDAYTAGNEQTKNAVLQSLSNWSDASAASFLLEVSRKERGTNYGDKALDGYVQLTSRSGYPDEQRLLLLRNAMVLASNIHQKQTILKEVGRCKTYVALLFAGKYLEDGDLSHEAAYAVMRIALSNKDWNGQMVQSLLEKSITMLNGPDGDYEKQAIRKHLSELPSGEGFVPLFNGKDLTGWKGLVSNPIERAKMDASTLAKKQDSADMKMRGGWFAKAGELVFSSNGDNLCTTKKYGDFEMFVDWKITKDGDAGIYLRGSPQVQIWDTSRVDVGAQVGSGGLYNNKIHESKPLKLADNAIGEWNSFHIIMKGDRVTVYFNGELVVDNTILENYWDRNQPIFPEEQIELQAHGTYVAYRDLYIKEIPRPK